MSSNLTLLPPEEGTSDYGPAFLALNSRQQRFVLAKVEAPLISDRAAARLAGYSEGSVAVTAFRVAHDPNVLAALKEEAEKMLHGDVLVAAAALAEIVRDPGHKDRSRVADSLLARAGLSIVEKKEVTHRHLVDDGEKVRAIVALAKQLGLDPVAVLGQAGVAIDAEFEVVSPPDATASLDEDWSIP